MSKTFDQETFDRDTITAFITAYPRELVLDVLRTLIVTEHKHRRVSGWELFIGNENTLPKNMQMMRVNGKTYIRSPEPIPDVHDKDVPENDRKGARHARKTDTSVRKADIRCPMCQSEMFREPICRGCKEGKAGYRVRLICGENDEHTWIV